MVRPLKKFKSYQEQIDNLITNHGLIINDRKRAEMILSSVSYYRLSAYGIGLKSQIDKEQYLPGITLEHIELVSQCPEANVAFMGFPNNWMQVLMVDRS